MIRSDAAKMIALYWGGAMVGRFYGSFMLSNVEKSKKYLYAVLVVALALFVGWFVGWFVVFGPGYFVCLFVCLFVVCLLD